MTITHKVTFPSTLSPIDRHALSGPMSWTVFEQYSVYTLEKVPLEKVPISTHRRNFPMCCDHVDCGVRLSGKSYVFFT